MGVVNHIEAKQRRKKTPVRFGHDIPAKIAFLGQMLLPSIERVEQLADGVLMRRLRAREAGPVNAIVDRLVK